jgi:glycosyltransferase involved in cell wall biosynthesis
VPINDIYDCQPPTKTFEYLSAGMPVLATKTRENAAVITERNGLLIDDTPQAFHEGLKKLMGNARAYRSDEIRRDALRHSWQAIVQFNLIPYINSVMED